jgi:hypothetical protein
MVFKHILSAKFAVDLSTFMFSSSQCAITFLTYLAESKGVTPSAMSVRDFDRLVILKTLITCKLMVAKHTAPQWKIVMNMRAETTPACFRAPVTICIIIKCDAFLTQKTIIKRLAGV